MGSENHQEAKYDYPKIRAPQMGQQWVYQVRNGFNGSIVDEITETVVSIAPVIEIRRVSAKHGKLPSEIHSSWGLISQDPYWSPAVQFLKPIPLWPQAAGNVTSTTNYKVEEDDSSYRWSSRITPMGSETISLGIGQFSTLKYSDEIIFNSNDFSRGNCIRYSTVWLSPEVGRWVERTTSGTYHDAGVAYGGERQEDFFKYELKSWK